MRKANTWTELVHARLKDRNAPDRFRLDKLEMKAVAERCKVRTPAVLASFDTAADIDLSTLPNRIALKPTHYAGKRGVFILERRKGGYFDRFQKEMLREADIRSQLTTLSEAMPRKGNTFVAEEFVRGENEGIPFDYKLYVFDGVVRFILQIDRNTEPASLAFMDGQFNPLPKKRIVWTPGKSLLSKPTRPRNYQAMLDTAKAISLDMKANFISVDLYTDGKAVTLGEITPAPGGPYFGGLFSFSPYFDWLLGWHWRRASKRHGYPIPSIADDPPVITRRQAAGVEIAEP